MPALTTEEFIARSSKRHGNFYTYEKTDYIKGNQKLMVTCPDHGDFQITGECHLRGQGCAQCKRTKIGRALSLPFSEFKKRSSKKHNNKYTYLAVDLKRLKQKVTIICPEHGEFAQQAGKHMSGQGCPACAKIRVAEKQTKTITQAVAAVAHLNLTVLNPEKYKTKATRLRFRCAKGHEFTHSFHSLRNQTHGCPECAADAIASAQRKSWPEVREAIAKLWPKYMLPPAHDTTVYTSNKSKLSICCPVEYKVTGKSHGEFQARANDLLMGHGCPVCGNARRSVAEKDLLSFVKSLNPEATYGSAKTTPGPRRFAPDIIIPSLKLAIEYEGLRWHSEKYKDSRAQADRREYFASYGWRVIFIFEDEWLLRPGAVKNRLSAQIPSNHNHNHNPRVFARKTRANSIPWHQAKEFLEERHTQGAGVPAKFCVGLFDGPVLVAVGTFSIVRFGGRPRSHGRGSYEFLRYASVGSVVGGMSKVFKYFLRNCDTVGSVVSYADLRWGDGAAYEHLGFSPDGVTNPGYSYVKGNRRIPRQAFQKHKLKEKLKVFDPSLTEVENCKVNGYYRIFDCGHSRWRFTP